MNLERLKKVFLLKNFTSQQVETLLSIGETQSLEKGTTLFTEGDKADALFFGMYGSVRIKQFSPAGEEVQVTLMGSGSHFGEISFVDEGFKRSATAEVLEHSEIIRFDYSRLRTLFQENPELGAVFYRGVAQFLAKRLRNTTHDFSANRDRLKQVA